MNQYQCKECGELLVLAKGEHKLHVRKYTQYRWKEEKKDQYITKRFMEKRYYCKNPECKDYYKKHAEFNIFAEPVCEHETRDIGRYMFEHCYICLKCGNMKCYDSSG
jgi:hypothetical protein